MTRRLVPALVAALAAGIIVVGLIVAGRQAAGYLGTHPRYRPAFADTVCDAPPGRERRQFLDEVQYLSSLPDRLDVLDPELPGRLREAFARHPCVARVESVRVGPEGVHVGLALRVAVLTVSGWPGGTVGETRAVDAAGVVLPRHVASAGLPMLVGPASGPAAPGEAWADPSVRAAARLAGWLHPHRDRLGVVRLQPDKIGGWAVWRADGSIIAHGPFADGEAGERQAAEWLAGLTMP